MTPSTHFLTVPGAMLKRGFWLYVWRVETPIGEKLYVGRTGDNSSPNAAAPYTRMGQHLGGLKNQNALRSHLIRQQIDPEACKAFHLIAYGPIFPEVQKNRSGKNKEALMALHKPLRDRTGALEKALADALKGAGYSVLNTVTWKPELKEQDWVPVLEEFGKHFPKLSKCT